MSGGEGSGKVNGGGSCGMDEAGRVDDGILEAGSVIGPSSLGWGCDSSGGEQGGVRSVGKKVIPDGSMLREREESEDEEGSRNSDCERAEVRVASMVVAIRASDRCCRLGANEDE